MVGYQSKSPFGENSFGSDSSQSQHRVRAQQAEISAWDEHINLSSLADLQHFTVVLAETPTASTS